MRRTPVLLLFLLTLFLSAFLLFCVQPLIAKMILPLLGGSPAVWTTCMVFFQAALLAGYLYAHAASTWLSHRWQTGVHVGLLCLALVVLPLGLSASLVESLPSRGDPVLWLLGALALTVGLPFFVVSASAPLLQHWFAGSGQQGSRDPYFLYAASNLGSMLALLGYPLLLEPSFRLLEQSRLWAFGYGLLIVLTACCAVVVWRAPLAAAKLDQPPGEEEKA